MASVEYEGEIIVRAAPSTRLTPNFMAREYLAADGSLFVHRDLVAGVQQLRDAVGKLNIETVKPRGISKGYGVSLKAEDDDLLLKESNKLVSEGVLADVAALASGAVVVAISDASTRKGLKPVFAFDCGLQVVACYETQGDPYQQVTGNFDKAGLSFGIIQYNFKSGTLQELLKMCRAEDENALLNCFSSEQQFAELWKVVEGSRRKAITWGDSVSKGSRKNNVDAEWTRVFKSIGKIESFRRIQLVFAYERYGKLLMEALAFLQGLTNIDIRNHRCLTALFDMCIQQGGYRRASAQIIARVRADQPNDEFELTRIAVEERAKLATVKYRADCLSRRLGILYRRPHKVTLDGHTATRKNRKSYLLRNVAVNGVDKYLHPELLRDVG